MKFVKYVVAVLTFFGIQYGYAQSINPSTQVQWSRAAGSGAPTATCPSSTNTATTATIGTPYTDKDNNVPYFCGVAGWFHPTNRAGDTISGPFQWSYTATAPA